MQKKRWFLIIVMIIIVGIIVYLNFFYFDKCKDVSCFGNYLLACEKAKFTNDAETAVWEYKIIGKYEDKCRVKVTLIEVKKGTVEMTQINGASMNCDVPLGLSANPEKNIGVCHGLLKEELQGLIIQKLHSYIMENLGKIETGLETPL